MCTKGPSQWWSIIKGSPGTFESIPRSGLDRPTRPQEVADLVAFRVLSALTKGVETAIRAHKQAGRPIAVEKNGKVVIIPPEEIEVTGQP